jgi:hypothetical protein
MNIHIARQIARKLRRQRAFSKLTKRSVGKSNNDNEKDGNAIGEKPDDPDLKI